MDFIFTSTVADTLSISSTLAVILSAILLGLIISRIYILTHKREGFSPSFSITLIMLPAIISIIILLVGNNVARAFSLAGAFSLIRFRSAPGDPKDIAYVFFTLGTGLACGMGYIGYAAVFVIIMCIVMVVLTFINYGTAKNSLMQLKITIPEDVDYQGLFDEIFDEYTKNYTLQKVKTTDFGALFELLYTLTLKENADQKKFIDRLRCRNGNLNIILTTKVADDRRSY